jgi:hypothetical protein
VIPVVQSIVGDGQDGRPMGDCLRACVASIFELRLVDVPHFAAEPNWFLALQRWLAPLGLVSEHASYSEPSSEPVPAGVAWPSGWWIATVDSENLPGHTHAVVMRGYYTTAGSDAMHEVAWDPSPRPRRTPYVFRGARWFAALDPAVIARAVRR